MNREVHVRLHERLRGKFPRSTRLTDLMAERRTTISGIRLIFSESGLSIAIHANFLIVLSEKYHWYA
jgi:hypothetical protein